MLSQHYYADSPSMLALLILTHSCVDDVHGPSGGGSRVQSGLKEHLKAEEVVSGSGVDDALSALQAASKVHGDFYGRVVSFTFT